MAHLFANIDEEYTDLGACYFSLFIDSNTIQTPLEIPAAFTKETGWPGDRDCCLVTSMSNMRQWPVQFLRRNRTAISVDSSESTTAISVAGGWNFFLRDLGIEVGKFLVFERVDERCLVVTVFPKNTAFRFKKTLRATHIGSQKNARLDIPTEFWRELGEEKFDGVEYTLRGPLSESVVKSCCHRGNSQTFCFFASGWREYRRLNDLKKGDTLTFSVIDTTTFHVTKSHP